MKKSTIKPLLVKILMVITIASASLLSASAQMMNQCNSHFFYGPDSAANSAQFMASNNGPGATFAWDFGDGGTATTAYARHTYAGPGTYYVCLTVVRSDSAGAQLCTSTHCDSVRFLPPPPPPTPVCNAHFISRNGMMGSSSLNFFAAQNAPGTTYAWDFGDGSSGTGENPSHTYAAAGSYYACLTVTTNDPSGATLCSANWCDSVHVQAPPPPPAPHCNAHFFYFSLDTTANVVFAGMRNWPNAQYSWDLGDGSTDTGRVVHHSYSANGVYNVCMTVSTYDSTGVMLCTASWCDSVRTGRPRFHHFHHNGNMGHHDNHRFGNVNDASQLDESGASPTAVFFPNPMNEKSVLHLENFASDITVKIMDQSGRIVSEKSGQSNGDISLDRNAMHAGMYYYTVTSGGEFIQGKFIIQ